ncbi:MAG: hypothetical protein J6C92_00180 [Bacteroidaceae bacterium]|nr:hypothetical protein [Bacteroidaceae bacterium]
MKIFRGLSNIDQAIHIAKYNNAGGFDNLQCSSFCHCSQFCAKHVHSISYPPSFAFVYSFHKQVIDEFIRVQVGDDSQMFPRIVNASCNDRWLVEYTTKVNIAKSFGLLGYIEAEIREIYANISINSPEGSVFCLSCAPLTNIDYYININAMCKKSEKQFKKVNEDCFIEFMQICAEKLPY